MTLATGPPVARQRHAGNLSARALGFAPHTCQR